MNNITIQSEQLLLTAAELIPGGVNSPVRAFGGVGGTPRFMYKAFGSRIWDVDGQEYIDFIGSWGPAILGHADPDVVQALARAAADGLSFGAASPGEIKLAQKIIKLMPGIEMVRLVNSGTEATMTAVRIARAWTRRNKIIKFAGCYHGHADSFLVQAGSGAMTLGIPTSPGVTPAAASDTLIAQFNSIDSVKELMAANPDQIAAVIIEPVVGNSGVILPQNDFLQELRDLTTQHDVLLIFDEVMTGFRLSSGGAQEVYGIDPDLTTLGKIIGGGMPVGAVGGKKPLMKLLAPSGPVYQAGTLSGNPLSIASGLATLNKLNDSLYDYLEKLAAKLEAGIQSNLTALSLEFNYQRIGSMGCLFFTDRPVLNQIDASTCDTKRFARYFHAMLDSGICLPPSQFEAFFISAAHSEEDIVRFVEANYLSLKKL